MDVLRPYLIVFVGAYMFGSALFGVFGLWTALAATRSF